MRAGFLETAPPDPALSLQAGKAGEPAPRNPAHTREEGVRVWQALLRAPFVFSTSGVVGEARRQLAAPRRAAPCSCQGWESQALGRAAGSLQARPSARALKPDRGVWGLNGMKRSSCRGGFTAVLTAGTVPSPSTLCHRLCEPPTPAARGGRERRAWRAPRPPGLFSHRFPAAGGAEAGGRPHALRGGHRGVPAGPLAGAVRPPGTARRAGPAAVQGAALREPLLQHRAPGAPCHGGQLRRPPPAPLPGQPPLAALLLPHPSRV